MDSECPDVSGSISVHLHTPPWIDITPVKIVLANASSELAGFLRPVHCPLIITVDKAHLLGLDLGMALPPVRKESMSGTFVS